MIERALDEHVSIAITDKNGKIEYVNNKFCSVSKYSSEEILGKDHRIVNSGYHSKAFMYDLWNTIIQGKTWKGEIDFIAELNGKIVYIQAAYLLTDEKTIEREFGAYEKIADNYPKYVITLDKHTNSRNGIIHYNLIDFLLRKKDLMLT